MSSQIAGYYNAHKKRLLKDFDKTCALMKGNLVAQFGDELTDTLQTDARKEYENLIPEIPYISGLRARMLNGFLLITAQELATYKALKKHGKSPAEAWELCHQALRLRVAKSPRWKRWLLGKIIFSNLVKKIFARREKQHQKVRFGDFEVEYLVGTGDDFDIGVNYLHCANYRFAMKNGGEEFAPYICMSDIALSDAMGWGLIRTQTLADGADYCDFRFKEGAVSQISSKTPEVQKTIERIRDKEADQL